MDTGERNDGVTKTKYEGDATAKYYEKCRECLETAIQKCMEDMEKHSKDSEKDGVRVVNLGYLIGVIMIVIGMSGILYGLFLML